jgi:phage gp16-like protein
MGAAALGWDDDTYRDILVTVTGKRSAGELDFSGRKRFLDHLRQCGWAGQPQRTTGAVKAPRKPLSPVQKLVWSLWQQLGDAGLVKTRTMAALNAWVERQTQVARMEWLTPAELDLVVESLKGWLGRAK